MLATINYLNLPVEINITTLSDTVALSQAYGSQERLCFCAHADKLIISR